MPDCSTIIGSIAINKVKDTPRPGGLSSMRLHRGAHELRKPRLRQAFAIRKRD